MNWKGDKREQKGVKKIDTCPVGFARNFHLCDWESKQPPSLALSQALKKQAIGFVAIDLFRYSG
jgi:hypothetical protein